MGYTKDGTWWSPMDGINSYVERRPIHGPDLHYYKPFTLRGYNMGKDEKPLIKIGTDYAVGGDNLCFTVYKKRVVKKTGGIKWDAFAYFTSLEALFHGLVDRDIGPLNNLQDIAERVETLKGWISTTLKDMQESPSFNDLMDKTKYLVPDVPGMIPTKKKLRKVRDRKLGE